MRLSNQQYDNHKKCAIKTFQLETHKDKMFICRQVIVTITPYQISFQSKTTNPEFIEVFIEARIIRNIFDKLVE